MSAAQSRGFTLIEMMITVVWPHCHAGTGAWRASVGRHCWRCRRHRRCGRSSRLNSAASGAERTLVATGSYPTALAPDYADRYTYTYTRATGGRAFVLKGSDSKLKLWAGLNSAGSRCTCRKCDPPAATAFTDGTLACPSGTDAF